MMKLKIEITMDNAAFKEADEGAETARILNHLAEVIEVGNLGMSPGAKMPLRDINGNRVGEAKVTRRHRPGERPAVNRQTIDLTGKDSRLRSTPWGMADFETVYAPGIVFFKTPSHGGFQISLDRLAAMPEPYCSHPPFCRQAGWYEEDCDWAVVALAFPRFFTETELEAARRTWGWMLERKTQDAVAKLKTSAALRAQDFDTSQSTTADPCADL